MTPSRSLRIAGLAGLLAASASGWAADPVAGTSKFAANCTACHTVASTATIDRGRNSPAMIRNAIATVGQMSSLSRLSTTDLEDIAAYLGNTPATLAFAQTPVGQTSSTQTVTIRASRFAPLANLAAAASGDFARQGGTCGSTLAVSASCTMTVAFTPTATGARTGTLSISHDGLTTPVAIALSGTGAAAQQATVALDVSTVAFGNQTIGVASGARTVHVSNTGNAPLAFDAIGVTGAQPNDFATGGTCAVGADVAAGGQCTVTVTFTPAATGARAATLSLGSNASNGTASVALSGTGVSATAPAVSWSAGTVAFGSVTVGTTSTARALTLRNSGSAPLSITSLVATAPFAQTDDCGATLAAGASCTVQLTFSPAATGASSGTLTLTSNAASSPDRVSLTGTGAAAATGQLAWSISGPVDFGTDTVGTDAATQTVTLSSTGSAPATLGALTLDGAAAADYRVDAASTCTSGQVLAVGAHCDVVIGFVASAVGTRDATLSIASADATVPAALALTGIGSAPAAPALTLSAASLDFVAPAGGTAAAKTLTLTNGGNADLHVSSIATDSARFTIGAPASGPCGAAPFVIAAGGHCDLTVAWAGKGGDAAETATLTLSGDMPGGTASVALAGEGATTGPANAGGGGCTVAAGTRAADPTLLALAVLATLLLWRRARAARRTR